MKKSENKEKLAKKKEENHRSVRFPIKLIKIRKSEKKKSKQAKQIILSVSCHFEVPGFCNT